MRPSPERRLPLVSAVWLLTVALVGGDEAAAVAQDKLFTCADASESIPYSHVNDDYCDCLDGSDENTTAACSHTDVNFVCENRGFMPKTIQTSKIADGICDCCDGSDERQDTLLCENTCQSQGLAYRQQVIERYTQIENGRRKRAESILQANSTARRQLAFKNKFMKEVASLEKLNVQLEYYHMKEDEQERALQLEAARELLSQARAKGKFPLKEKTQDPLPDAEPVKYDVNGLQSIMNLAVALSDGGQMSLTKYMERKRSENAGTGKAKRKTRLEMRRQGLGAILNARTPEEQNAAIGRLIEGIGLILAPVRIIWELGLMAKGKARVLFGGVHSANSANTTDTDEPEPPSAFDQNMTMPEQILKDLRRAVRRLYRSIFTSKIEWALGLVWNAMPSYCYYYFPDINTSLVRPEARSISQILDVAKIELQRMRQDQGTLDPQQRDLDYGPDNGFLPLDGQCFSKTIQEYTYRVCPFHNVTQGTTLLGKWKSWEIPPTSSGESAVQMFADGIKCYNGPARSASVQLVCSEDNEIEDIAEPNKCAYNITLLTPNACHDGMLLHARALKVQWEARQEL